MKQLFLKNGAIVVEVVPPPAIEPGHVLVRTAYSCISVGTELAGVAQSSQPLWRRAVDERERIGQVVAMAKASGIRDTVEFIHGKLSNPKELGYSLAGHVIGAAADVSELRAGDLVACGGAQCAHHAEVVCVPKNLVVRAPKGISARDASMATVGAIALQGVRRAAPTLGETFVVIGLGLLGLLTVQLLKANGCTVIGADIDPARVAAARALGADFALSAGDSQEIAVLDHTSGHGADGVIITAGSKSDEIMSTAFRFTRKKGRVVIVGDVGLSLQRADFYAKEIDVLISSSYGPGRYDRTYEEAGLDYPLPFVRWTEARNIACFMDLVAGGRVSIDALGPSVYPLDRAADAYSSLAQRGSAPVAVFLAYDSETPSETPHVEISPRACPTSRSSRLRLAIIGAGAFAGAIHVPNLRRMKRDVEVVAVAGRSGSRAAAVARQFGASAAISTDIEQVVTNPSVDAVLIATRHDSHARLVLRALECGKHVFVEKPTVTTREDLERIEGLLSRLQAQGHLPVLVTGYNRRFSSFAVRARDAIRERSAPIVINYRMAAGYLPRDHWTKSPEGGGRNIGEACHIYDLFRFLVSSPVAGVTATPLGGRQGAYQTTDNFVTTVSFDDGSIATLSYTAQGSPTLEKERLELFSERTAIVIDNWRTMTVHGRSVERDSSKTQDKGFAAELEAFVEAARGAREWPISWAEQRDVAEIAFRAEEQLYTGTPCAG